MADHLHQSVEVAVEAAPGALDSIGVPLLPGALTFVAAPVVRGSRFSEGIETRKADLNLDAPHGAQSKLIPVAPVNPDTVMRFDAAAGARMRVMQGEHTLIIPVYGEGAGADATGPLHTLLATFLGRHVPPGAATNDTCVGIDTLNLTVTTIVDYEVGMGIYIEEGGVNQYRIITAIDTATAKITLDLALTGVPGAATPIRYCATYFPLQGNSAPTVALRFYMDSRVQYSAMCRVSACTISVGDEGIAQFELTVKPQGVLRDDANATDPIAFVHQPGLPVILEQGETLIGSTVVGTATPASSAITNLALSAWSISLEARLAPERQPRNILGVDGVEVLSTQATITLTDEEGTIVEPMFLAEEERTVAVNLGPFGKGQGMGFHFMAAANRVDSLPGEGEDDRQAHEAELMAVAYSLDDTSQQDGTPSDTAWRLVFPLSEP